MSPLHGIALSTNFTFTCNGWTDSEAPLTYEFSYGNNKTQTTFFYRTSASGVGISVTDWLVAGDKTNNYTISVGFTIKDSLGSQSSLQIVVQVGLSNRFYF